MSSNSNPKNFQYEQLGQGSLQQWPRVRPKAEENLVHAFRSGQWGHGGHYVELLTEQLQSFHGVRHALPIVNGTVALEIVLRSLGVAEGDEVVLPALTAYPTLTAVLSRGAVPIYADVESDTALVSAETIRSCLSERTKAVILVHLGGRPCDMDAVASLCAQHGVPVIEDCAQAFGAEWRGQKVGTFGAASTLSFQETKPLPSGEGGAILTNDDKLAEVFRSVINCGRILTKSELSRPLSPADYWDDYAEHYTYYSDATNARLTNFQAAVLCAHLEEYDAEIQCKQVVAQNVRDISASFSFIEFTEPKEFETQNAYYYLVGRYQDEKGGARSFRNWIERMYAQGLFIKPGYPRPLYRQPVFTEQARYWFPRKNQVPNPDLFLKNAEELCGRMFFIPGHYLLHKEFPEIWEAALKEAGREN